MSSLLNKVSFIVHPYLRLFGLLWLAVAIIYLPAYQAGFHQDFHSTLQLYHEQSFIDYINRTGIGNQSLYQVTQLILYAFISVFGIHVLPWFLLFTLLHAVNGTLIYYFFKRLFQRLSYNPHKSVILLGCLFFLFAPVQAETVIWKAALHYLTGVAIIFIILHWLLCYLQLPKSKYIIAILCLYFVSTFTLEIFYLTPAFVFIILLSLRLAGNISKEQFKQSFTVIFLGLVAIWILHLLSYHFIYHKWVAHYELDLAASFTFQNIFGKINKYLIHIFMMEYLWPREWQTKAYEIAMSLPAVLITSSTLVGSIVLWLFQYRKTTVNTKAMLALLAMGFASFILILPMWFSDLGIMRNDRYYYLPSIFLFMFLSVAIGNIKPQKLSSIIAAIYLLINIAATENIIWKARDAAKVFWGMINHFKWFDAKQVYLLNLPNNFEGIGIIPADSPSNFNAHLKVFGKDTIHGKVFDVSSYNLQQFHNGAHVVVQDSMHLLVTLNEWGGWWWYRTLGATDYENEWYKAEGFSSGHEYRLSFKQKPDSAAVILYQQGDQWRRVDMKKIGEEQW